MPAPLASLFELLQAHWVLHLAWPDPQEQASPHCTPLYYALLRPRKECVNAAPSLVFFSDPKSEHGQRQRIGLEVGASIALQTEDIARIEGATLRGRVRAEKDLPPKIAAQSRVDYLARHPNAAPFVASSKATLYLLTLTWAKLTDNRRGFGQHLIVECPPPPWLSSLTTPKLLR